MRILSFMFITMPILGCLFITFMFVVSASAQTIKNVKTYEGKALYGFMNGGSDLYFEYGFQSLTDQDVVFDGEEYDVEIYKMSSAQNSFGIYSQNTFRCLRADTLGLFDCQSTHQLQAVRGDCYISIVFPSGSTKARFGADALLGVLSKNIEDKIFEVPNMLLEMVAKPVSGAVKYFAGPLSLSNVNHELFKLLDGYLDYKVWQKGSTKSIIFADDKSAEKFVFENGDVNILKIENNIVKVEL